MSETVKKYAVVNVDTGETLTTYDSQAPATTLAKYLSKPHWGSESSTPRLVVEERTYTLLCAGIVRTVKNGEIL